MTTPSRGPLGASLSLLGKLEGAERMLLSGRRSREADLENAVTFFLDVKYSSAFIIMPGGFGTLDEALAVITLIQTGKLDRIVIMGGRFWEEMRDFVRRTMVDEATIDASDLDLAQPAESPEEALRLVERGRRRDGDAG